MKNHSTVPAAYIVLLAFSAGVVSFIGATFSISGLARLFAGAPLAVMFMAGALEFAKVVSAGFLHQNWSRLGIGLKAYLSCAVGALIVITSLGIFGYLSHAFQKSAAGLKNAQIKIDTLLREDQKIQEEVNRLQKSLDDIPSTRVSKRVELQKELEPQFQNLKKRSFEVNIALQQSYIEKQSFQTEIGPLAYVADAFNVGMDQIAKWLIMLFVCVFDPLAICLVFATSWSIKTRRADLAAWAEEEEIQLEKPPPDSRPLEKSA